MNMPLLETPRMRPGERPLRYHLTPIQHHLDDPATTEVVINRPGEVGVEQRGNWRWFDVPAFTHDRLDQICILAGAMTGRDFDSDHPLVGSTLPDGQRIQMCREPATLPGTISIAIRKPSERRMTLDDDDMVDMFSEIRQSSSLVEINRELRDLFRSGDQAGFFRLARKVRKTIDCCGETGSGKTSFARRLMLETHPEARIVTLESDPEFGDVGPRNTANLVFNEQHPELSPEKSLAAVLRMRPDEIWFQETRGPEAFAVLRARAAGHRGGGTTWHAEEGKEIDALALMVRQHPAATHLPDEKIREICMRFVDIIVYCTRDAADFRVTKVYLKNEAGELEAL
jgi:type IV secretion system protein VirB11